MALENAGHFAVQIQIDPETTTAKRPLHEPDSELIALYLFLISHEMLFAYERPLCAANTGRPHNDANDHPYRTSDCLDLSEKLLSVGLRCIGAN
jgi:hypothetical protein